MQAVDLPLPSLPVWLQSVTMIQCLLSALEQVLQSWRLRLLQDVVWDSFHDQPNDDGWYPFGEGVSATEQRGRTFLHWLMQR